MTFFQICMRVLSVSSPPTQGARVRMPDPVPRVVGQKSPSDPQQLKEGVAVL